MKKLIGLIMSICMCSSVFLNCNYAYADDSIQIPEPLKVVDFSYSFTDLSMQDKNFSVEENGAAPQLINDSEMGRVLKLGESVMGEETECFACGNAITDNSSHSIINLSNPYKGLEELKECEPYESVPLKYFSKDGMGSMQPEWKKGITITYWIKADEYINSNVLGFYSERFQMHADDYGKYYTTYSFDIEYNRYTEEEKDALGINDSGVDRNSDYYFEYAEEKTYNDKPLYTCNLGKVYWMNKNYVPGYILNEDGSVTESKGSEFGTYADYKELPYLGDTKEEHDAKKSNIRYAWTRSEMWIDASSSIYYNSDVFSHSSNEEGTCDNNTEYNIQLNENDESSFGKNIAIDSYNWYSIDTWGGDSSFEQAYENRNAIPSPLSEINKWHYVSVVIQNDWVSFYLDGKEIDNYDVNVPISDLWKRFNKGAGARYSYGKINFSEYYYTPYFKGFVSPTIMDWIIMDSTELVIGGGNKYRRLDTCFKTNEILIKNIVFYDEMLSAEQISYLASCPEYYSDRYPYLGDANEDNKVSVKDALLLLKHAAHIEELENTDYLDVNFDKKVNAEDALQVLKYVANIISSF